MIGRGVECENAWSIDGSHELDGSSKSMTDVREQTHQNCGALVLQ